MEKPTPRTVSNDFVAFLASTELLGGLNESILHDLATNLEWVHLPSGVTLIRQGDVGDCVYIVSNGRLRVYVEDKNGDEVIVGEVGRGECVGEMAILSEEDRSATVYAIRDTELVKFSKAEFDRLIEKYPQAMMRIARIIVSRLRRTIRLSRLVNSLATIAVIPVDKDVPLSDFTDHLATTLAATGSTLHLNADRFDSSLEKGAAQTPLNDANNSKIVAWLNEQETKYRFVIYESDAISSLWTSRCIRQADHILIVGQAESEPIHSEVVMAMLDTYTNHRTAHKELVLLHQDESKHPVRTKRWLSMRQVDAHHHVRLHNKADFERLVRLLTGRAVGLVLGGGGARGFAHIGVIRALEEAKIPIDLIGGTSMGSVVAAAHALGWDYQVMLRKIRAIFKNPWSLFDVTLPIVSLFTGRKIVKILKKTFGSTKIEDLWMKYFCVSSNLTRAKIVVHQEGSLWRSVRASCALPGITPPLFYERDMLVDGGVLNNLPIDVMNKLCKGGPVIAVDVSSQVDLETSSKYGDCLSGWKVLWSRINPFVKTLNVPHIISILMRTTELSSRHSQEAMIIKGGADLYINPPVEDFGILEFDSAEKIIDIGYHFALKKIEKWKNNKVFSEEVDQFS
ncbi:MAG: cyclic nucleotide-binding and patatin-like phospholipase domain-containing protein [bacterium]